MRSLFTAALNQALNTLIDSDTITLSGIGTGVPFTLITGAGTSAYKNGANVTSTTVSDGDRIRIRVRSSTAYATPAFGVVKIGSEETIFSVVTQVDPTLAPVESMANMLPIDLTQYSDGQEYIPSNINNAVSVYLNGTLNKTVPLVAPASNTPRTGDGTMLANYHGNQVFFLNANLDVASAIKMEEGGKPYGIAATATSPTDDTTLIWVTLSGLNKVVALNPSYQVVATYPTGVRPLGIATSPEGSHVYVANYGSNTVTHFTYANGAWTGTAVPVGSKPFEIAVDASNNAWVSHVGEDKIYKITPDNVATGYAVASNALRGIAVDKDGAIWVAASKSNAIVKLSAAGATLLTIPTGKHPYAVSISSDTSVDVTCFADAKIQSFALDGTKVRDHATSKFPYGSSSFLNYTVVANLYSNTPEYIIAKDQAATQFGLIDPTRIPKASVITSNTFTVSGLTVGTSVVAAVSGDVFNSRLIKNGNAVGPNTTVTNGDTLALQFNSPNVFDMYVEIPLYIGNTFESFVSRTEIEDVTPDAFTFNSVLAANLNEIYTSNAITIAGLTANTSVPFSIDTGKIVLNGVENASRSINVRNGDTIALRLTSPAAEKSSIYITATSGSIITRADGSTTEQYRTVWRVTTKTVNNEVWIHPNFQHKDEFEPRIPASSSNVGKYVTRIGSNNVGTSLAISNVISELLPTPFLIPSYFDGAVYQLNGSQFSLIGGLDATKRPVDVANNRYVAYDGVPSFVLDTQTNQIINLPATPRKIAYVAVSDTLYVSLADGTMAVLPLGSESMWIHDVVQIGGSPYALAANAEGIWVSDIENDVVHFVSFEDHTITRTLNTGGGVWDMAVSSTHMWTANSYDNSVSKINLTTEESVTTKVGSVPNQIEIDGSGVVWVSHYASKTVIRLNADTNAKLSEYALAYSAPTYMAQHEGSMYVTELHTTLVETQKKVSALLPLDFDFTDVIDELPSTRVLSNEITISKLIRPTRVFIEPDNNYDLYVNGVKSQTGSEVVFNGDKVYLDVLAASTHYTARVVTLNDYQSSVTFSVRTETNVKPETLVFADVFDAIPGNILESTEATIRGMTPGHSTTLSVSRAGWQISLNGGVPANTAVVKNDDVVKLVGPVRGSYNTFTLYKVYSGKFNYQVGTFTVHNKELDGASVYALYQDNWIQTYWTSRTHRSLFETQFDRDAEILPNGYRDIQVPEFELQRSATLLSDTARFELGRRYRIQSLFFETQPELGRTHRIQGLIFEAEPQLERRYRIQGLEFDSQGELRSRNEVYFSNVNSFEARPSSNQYTSPAPEVELRPSSNQHTSPAPEVELRSSANQFTFNSLQAVKVVRTLVDAELETNSMIPTLFSRAIRFREVNYVPFEKSTAIAPKAAPLSEYQKRAQTFQFTEKKEFDTNPRRLQNLIQPVYERRLYREFPTVAALYERRLYREPYFANSFYQRQAQYPQLTFANDGAVRYEQMRSRYFSPLKEFDRNSNSNYSAKLNQFVILSHGKGVEAEFAQFVRIPNALVFNAMAQATRVERSVLTGAAPTVELMPSSLNVIESPKFEKLPSSFWLIDMPLNKAVYKVHEYTFAETADIEGAYASATEAVAAGRAAGHEGAYAVMIGKNRFMWAVAIESGDFCGVVSGPPQFPIPEKWYVHGG